jgi:cytochrome c oxidase subunit 2
MMHLIERWVPSASTFSHDIDFIFSLVFWIVGGWFVLVQCVFFWLILRFRKRDGVRAQYITGEIASQKRWVFWPHLLVLCFDVWILIVAIGVWYDVKQNLPEAQETVRVVAQQWAWSFVHPGPDGQLDTADDIKTVDELHVKVGTLYHAKLEARDVLHSFSVPVFRLKQDVIPGRVITVWFQATMTGSFDIQCAEICGIGHALMPGRIVIETPEQHTAWMASQSPVTLAAAGAPTGLQE